MININTCVLQVEDESNDIYLLEYSFREICVTTPLKAVRDGQEAIDYLSGAGKYADRTEFPLPCLTLLDLKMPRKSGFEVLEWIRAYPVTSALPVIICSSSANESDIRAAYKLGANAYVVKPSNVDVLLEFVRALDTFWLRYNRTLAPSA